MRAHLGVDPRGFCQLRGPRRPPGTVIVDDNSPDGTGQVADQLTRDHRVRVIHRAGKLGLGSAVVEGFAVASAPVVGVMDADFSHPPTLIPKLFIGLERTDADAIIASR